MLIKTLFNTKMREHIRGNNIESLVLTDAELVEISVGLAFVAFGGVMLSIAFLRRKNNSDIFDNTQPFVTSGYEEVFKLHYNSVAVRWSLFPGFTCKFL
ncbi:hypothetical protein Glove_104g54 [Diversispora epigaea]|uniref:Uncharacterized protein n=1 Tax=Diversispora epigaea TaxID=1348612 RepID=A0A397JCK2_9GLOM|nr:hypothetical protein Glove_104g54 [Diversispora epigaea]